MEDAGDDVGRVQLVRVDDLGERLGRGQHHVLVDRRRGGIEQAAEDAGEDQHVVDLVGEVGAAGSHHGSVLGRRGGVDLGLGVGHGEDDRPVVHGGDVVAGEDSGC